MPLFRTSYSPQYAEDGSPIQRRGKFKILPLIIFGAFALFYIFGNQEEVPLTGRKHIVSISHEEEAALGLQSYREVLSQAQVVPAGPEVELVRSVGERIATATENKAFEWEFNVLKSSDANAFALPGGKVAVYSGILPYTQNTDGLAVVMGHEVAHAIARHGAERMAHQQLAQIGQLALGMAAGDMDPRTRQMIMGVYGLGSQYGIMLPFSREHESEADYMGLMFMSRACFNPQEAPLFWERMSKSGGANPPEFLSTHPSHDTRISQLKAWIPEALAERAKYCKN